MFRNEYASRARISEWARRLKEVRSIYDDERAGAPARMQRSQMKVMLVCFFDVHFIVHHEYVPPHQIVTAKFYLEVLGHLQARITRVCIMTMHRHIHRSWYANIWGKNIPTLPHPPYSPDLALQLFSIHQTQVDAERDVIR